MFNGNTTIFIAHARARQGSSKSDQGNTLKTSWRWGESNPLRDRFASFRFGWSVDIRPAQDMFSTLLFGTFRGRS